MILIRIWGIASNHRKLRRPVDLVAEVDRARKETIQFKSSRYLEPPI